MGGILAACSLCLIIDKLCTFAGEVVINVPASCRDEKLLHIKCVACRLTHGRISWLNNTLTQVASVGRAKQLDHWWVEIRTAKAYYTVNLAFNGDIFMDRFGTAKEYVSWATFR